MFNTPGMQSLMSQLTQNPQLMQNMMQAPYMQTMMQTLSANPEMAQQVIGQNPMFADNPQMQEYMRTMLPTFMQQVGAVLTLSNPHIFQQNLPQEPPFVLDSIFVYPGMRNS